MYGCDSWTVKKAETRRTDAFELWCWRRLLRVLWTARRCNQCTLKEISPGCSLEGLILKLKLQYFGHLMRRVDSLEKTLMLGGIGSRKTRGQQRMRWPKYWSFSFRISPSNEHPGLISFRMDWLDLLAVQGRGFGKILFLSEIAQRFRETRGIEETSPHGLSFSCPEHSVPHPEPD